jgi:hypothetical protein
MKSAHFQHSKIEIAKMVLNIESEALLEKIRSLLLDPENDWWEELTESQKAEILKGQEDVKKGRTISMYEFVKKIS